MVRERLRRLMEFAVGRYRLRVEVVKPDVLRRVRRKGQACRQGLSRRDDPVQLRERVERLRVVLVFWIGQRSHGILVQQILGAFEKIELVLIQRAAGVEPWRRRFHTVEMSAADTPIRKWIVQAEVPLVSAPPCLGGHYPCSKSSILGE